MPPTAGASGNGSGRSGSGRRGISAGLLEKVLDLCRTRSLVARVPPPRRPSDEQHAGPADGGMNRYFDHGQHLHGSRRRAVALPGLGVAVELRPLAPGDDAKEPRLALPRRTAQPAPLPRLLAAEPVDLRVPGRIPMSIPQNP